MGIRACARCGASIPWGVPQCPGCGAWTFWRRLLAGFGLAVGAGTALAVVVVLARVWLLPPPANVQRDLAVQAFLAGVASRGELRAVVRSARPCGSEHPDRLCIGLAPEFIAFEAGRRDMLRDQLVALWSSAAGEHADGIELLVAPTGARIDP